MTIDVLRQAQGNNLSDTLSTSIGSTDTTIPVNTISIWSASGGKVIIDRGLSTQEIVYCSGVSGSSLVVQAGGRGLEGTTAQGHNVGAAVESVPTAKDWNDLVTSVENALVKSTGLLDTTKVVDLTTAQTLTNKTLTSPVISTISNTGTVTLPTATDTLVGRATTDTLTNKRRTRRVVTTTQSATPTINTDNTDVAVITGLAQAITSFTTNLSGTPSSKDLLEIDITDNGTARAITWGSSFESTTVTLPTTTVISTELKVLFEWNPVASKWDCVATA